LIIGGSVANGYARDDSDVDFMIIAADEVFEEVRAFHDWGVSDLEAYTWFMTDVEWSWMSGSTPIEDW
jgi:predicted nucleotidyltransferase